MTAEELFRAEFRIRREDLRAYAEASGDRNPIHLDDEAARAAGLDGVIAHGMYTMGLAGRALSDWLGGPERIEEFSARFAKPVPVPDTPEGTVVEVRGVLRRQREDGRLELNLTALHGTTKVLAPSRAVVRPAV